MEKVKVSIEKIKIPTYIAADYERLPMFTENRIHQRTSGNPYPNPVINRVGHDEKQEQEYTAVILENEFIQTIILPEIGGRIFAAQDKTNSYDFFYRQHVIKPALIGIFGLWMSGGVEFNWPMHHKPSTFLPVDFKVEEDSDGSATVWLSEHDPLDRMKGMVGVHLAPGRGVLDTKMRIYNRTEFPKSFLWWENAAVPVNADYQIFFPPDVTHVHFHRKKAVGGYPVMDEFYNVQDNRGGNDIRFLKNTKEATSYFSGPSKFDFFGGYDHGKNAGVIHYSSHHTSPGKKCFTWGWDQLSRAWEDALTDKDGAYAELMAGSYSDNQPDFTWIEPFEVKEFTQSWYPYKDIGEPQNANALLALRCEYNSNGLKVNLYPTETIDNTSIEFEDAEGKIVYKSGKLTAARAECFEIPLPDRTIDSEWFVSIVDANGRALINYHHQKYEAYVPKERENNPLPDELKTADDCFLTGVHIIQYRDPLITPDTYWEQGLKIDPNHAGCLKSMGQFYMEKYRYDLAEDYLRRAVSSLIRFNPNPRDTESYYLLGLTLKRQGKLDEAYELLNKALWGKNSILLSYYCIAQIDSLRGDYSKAEEHLLKLVELSGENQKALCLLSAVQRKQKKGKEANLTIAKVLEKDSLDFFALNEIRVLNNTDMFSLMKSDSNKTVLDIAFDYSDAGLYHDAYNLLYEYYQYRKNNVSPIIFYSIGYFARLTGNSELTDKFYKKGSNADEAFCFPSLYWEKIILLDVISTNPKDASAMLYLGNLLYGKTKQYKDALKYWSIAAEIEPNNVQLLRNISIARFNLDNNDGSSFDYLNKAAAIEPDNLQLCYEQNLLAELSNFSFDERTALMEKQKVDFSQWDDLYLQKVHLKNQIGEWKSVLDLLSKHKFVPCEGGEHSFANEYLSANFAMAWKAFNEGFFEKALNYFKSAQNIPINLGGGVWHKILYTPYILGEGLCLNRLNKKTEAKIAFNKIIYFPVNYFATMYLPSFQYYRGCALQELGMFAEGKKEFEALLEDAENCKEAGDFGHFEAARFFNSYFESDKKTKKRHYSMLYALAYLGLGEKEKALEYLKDLLSWDFTNITAKIYYNYIIGEK